MKINRLLLCSLLPLALAACAPRASAPQPAAAPEAPTEEPAPVEEPVTLIRDFDPLFNLTANGKKLPYRNESWIFENPDFRLAASFAPADSIGDTLTGTPGLLVALVNKGSKRVALVWDETSFISAGEASKVFHVGVRYAARDEPQAPTVVPPGARIEDQILPSDYTFYSEVSNDWLTLPIVQSDIGPKEKANFRFYVMVSVGDQFVPVDMKFARK